MLLTCEILFYLSFEYLNTNTNYLKISSHKIFNWLFVLFVGFVVLVRADLFSFPDGIDYHINTLEHLFFSGIVCLTISIYFKLFSFLPDSLFMKLLLVFLICNCIGVINEFFQNLYQERPFFSIEGNDIKDVTVNFFGSFSFVVLSLIHSSKAEVTDEIEE